MGKAKDLESARIAMEAWESEVTRYEIKYATKVQDMDKVVALKSMMPDVLFGEEGKFRGAGQMSWKMLKDEVTKYLRDRPMKAVASYRMSPVNLGSLDMPKVEKSVDEGHEAHESKRYVTMEDLCQLGFKGQGKGGGKAGEQPPKKSCWKCGKEGHFQR